MFSCYAAVDEDLPLPDFVDKLEEPAFQDCFNKSVPFYFWPTDMTSRRGLLTTVVYNYVYRRWFQPYRTDLDARRFIAKFIKTQMNCSTAPIPSSASTRLSP